MHTREQLKANRKLWVDALRSGEYRQTTGELCDNVGYCCLGVLAVVSGLSPEAIAGFGTLEKFRSAMDFVGLADDEGLFYIDKESDGLADRNDRGTPFAEIADIIESEPEGLFW